MADTVTEKSTDPGATDPIKNVKAEFDRKMGNFEGKLSSLEQTNAALLSQLKAMAPIPTKTEKKEPKLKDIWYDDPEAAAKAIKEEAKAELRKEFQGANQQQQRQTATLNSLVTDFPELQDTSHEFTKRAVELYTALPEEEKGSPAAYKAAVREAALEMGVKPMSKRDDNYVDQFTGISGGSSTANRPRQNKRSAQLDPATLSFAEAVGLDITDTKVKDRLLKHAQRDFRRYR
jgi:hypothetical protein